MKYFKSIALSFFMSLYLGMEIPNWPPDNIAELSKKLEEQI